MQGLLLFEGETDKKKLYQYIQYLRLLSQQFKANPDGGYQQEIVEAILGNTKAYRKLLNIMAEETDCGLEKESTWLFVNISAIMVGHSSTLEKDHCVLSAITNCLLKQNST